MRTCTTNQTHSVHYTSPSEPIHTRFSSVCKHTSHIPVQLDPQCGGDMKLSWSAGCCTGLAVSAWMPAQPAPLASPHPPHPPSLSALPQVLTPQHAAALQSPRIAQCLALRFACPTCDTEKQISASLYGCTVSSHPNAGSVRVFASNLLGIGSGRGWSGAASMLCAVKKIQINGVYEFRTKEVNKRQT